MLITNCSKKVKNVLSEYEQQTQTVHQVVHFFLLCNKNTSRANLHTTHKMGEKYIECNRKK